jgi:hypothetical protein
MFAQDCRHGGFSPIGHHFDGVDEMFALGAQLLESLGVRKFQDGDVAWCGFALGFGGLDSVLQ